MVGRYKAYPEYKNSEVQWLGVVPAHWKFVRLKELADVINGYPFDSKLFEPSAGIPLVRIRDIASCKTEVGFVGDVPVEALIADDDILIGMDGDFNVARWKGGVAALNQRVACVRACNIAVQDFVFYVLPFCMRIINDLTYFTTVKHLSNADICKARFALPSDSELIAIIEFLNCEVSKVDILIRKQQQLIQLLREKRHSVIGRAVTKGLNSNIRMCNSEIEWLGDIPEHWKVAKLSYRYEVLLGKMLDDKKITGQFLGKYLRNTDVQWGHINEEGLPEMDFRPGEQQRYSVVKGDLVVCEGGEVGRSAIWDKDYPCFYQKALHRLRPLSALKDDSRFMYFVLFDAAHQQRFVSGTGNATIAHLPAETFRQFRFAYPPYDEQVSIAKYLDIKMHEFDALEAKAIQQISLLQERRIALISAAVTGKIDVRDWVAPEGTYNNKEVAA